MKKIDGGWQFTVYKISNDRVLKLPKSYFSQFITVLLCGGPFVFLKQPVQRVRKDLRSSLLNLQSILLRTDFPAHLLGNPIIDISTFSYTQDFVETLDSYMQRSSFEQKEKILTQYPKLLKSLWDFGVSEKVFNFKLNMGVDASGRLIFTDLGEFDFDKKSIISDIQTKRWLRAANYRFLKDLQLQKSYSELMGQSLTVQEFESRWRSRI